MSGFLNRWFDAWRGRSAVPARVARTTAAVGPSIPPVVAVVNPPSADSVDAASVFAASIRHLPLFSSTATQLIRSIGDDDTSGREMARLIATDAALVAHLLRIVNSPFYGLANRVATVPDALTVMGADQVRRLVTAAILQRPLMSYLHDSRAARAFWRHELACASLSRFVATKRGVDGETAYMAGLMHDVGRLALLIRFPQHVEMLHPAVGDDDPAARDAEVARFGFDHAQAGGALLALWGLPEALVDAVAMHESPVEPHDALTASVWHANRAAHAMAMQPDDDDGELPWMARIGLDAAGRRRIVDEIRALEGA